MSAASSSAHPHYLALVLIGALCFALYLVYIYLSAHDRLPWTQTLVSAPAFLRDPYARNRDIDHLLAGAPTPGRVTYARTDSRHYLETPHSHALLVIGGAGSRKTTGILAPAARAWVGPAVLVSTKPDLITHTARSRPNPLLFQPGATASFPPLVGWSPLDAIRDRLYEDGADHSWSEAIRTADAMTATNFRASADGLWTAAAAQALAPFLLAASLAAGADVAGLVTWVRRRDFTTPLSILRSHQAPDQAVLGLADLSTRDERIQSRIMTGVGVAIRPFDDPRILAAATMRNRFRPAMLLDPQHPSTTLYLLGGALTQGWLTPVYSGLLDELARAWFARSDELMRRPGANADESVMPPDERLLLVLDDATELTPMPNLDKLAATGGSHGVVLALGLQDLSRLRERYGATLADSVITNCQTRVLTRGMGDASALRLINELIGQAEVQTTTSTELRDILTTAELREMNVDSAIVINGSDPPIRAYLLDRDEFVDSQPSDDRLPTAGALPVPPRERRWPFQPRDANQARDR